MLPLLNPHLGILKTELGKKLPEPKCHSLPRHCLRELHQAPSASVNETLYLYIRPRQITSTVANVVKELLFSTTKVGP